MNDTLVQLDQSRPALSVITLNRPEKRNALNIPLLGELCKTLETVNSDPLQRAIVLRGAGPVFCAGLDLEEARDPEKAHASAELVAGALQSVMQSPKVTIAAVQGAAIAGGAGLMFACDFAVVSEDFRTGFPEVRRGLVAGLVMTFLRRKMPESKARALLLLGELIGADEALSCGIIHRVVPPEQLMDTALDIADTALKGAPGAIARTKALFDELYHLPVSEHVSRALDLHKEARTSAEAAEGLQAFAEKRPPGWDASGK